MNQTDGHAPPATYDSRNPQIESAATAGDDSHSVTRLSRIRVLSSVRFRLTMWYTLVLVVFIVVLSLMLSNILSRSLKQDVDTRLLQASTDAFNHTEQVETSPQGTYVGSSAQAIRSFETDLTPNFSALVTSGLFVFAMDPQREVYYNVGVVPDDMYGLIDLDVIIQGHAGFQTLSINGQELRVFSTPVFDRNQSGTLLGAIVVGESLEPQNHAIEMLNQLLRTGGAVGILVAMGTGWILAGRALAPVNRITRTANLIARKGDAQESLATRLDVGHGKDELARLAGTFNDMLERIERAFKGQRRFVADASHELRTPLTAIRGNVDVLLRASRNGHAIEPEELQEALGDVQRESGRMARLIEDLLLLARTDAEGLGHMVNPEPVSLDVVAREAFRTAEALASGQRLHISVRQPLMIHGDGDRLVQVIIILLENAIRHTPSGGTIDLIVDAAEAATGEMTCARLRVADSGEGIPAEHMSHLFERFYRVEESRNRQAGGSGLGLSIALAIVQGHNGWINVESTRGYGTTMTVWLPILESPEGDSEPLVLVPGQMAPVEDEASTAMGGSTEERFAD